MPEQLIVNSNMELGSENNRTWMDYIKALKELNDKGYIIDHTQVIQLDHYNCAWVIIATDHETRYR